MDVTAFLLTNNEFVNLVVIVSALSISAYFAHSTLCFIRQKLINFMNVRHISSADNFDGLLSYE